jgi:hypothetical protein
MLFGSDSPLKPTVDSQHFDDQIRIDGLHSKSDFLSCCTRAELRMGSIGE